MNKIKLFCFPYAGGISAAIYSKWRPFLSGCIELYPLELAGRGKRCDEPLYKDFDEVINDLYGLVSEYIDDSPYAFYGHSMGSYIVYQLVHRIIELGRKQPIHCFFSASCVPYARNDMNAIHKLCDMEFASEIYKLGGMPWEIFSQKELLDVFICPERYLS